MIFTLVHGFAHRLLKGGTIESAPVTETTVGNKKVYSFVEGEFESIAPSGMNMTGAQHDEVRIGLQRYNQIMPEDFHLPVSNTPEVLTQSVASDPV